MHFSEIARRARVPVRYCVQYLPVGSVDADGDSVDDDAWRERTCVREVERTAREFEYSNASNKTNALLANAGCIFGLPWKRVECRGVVTADARISKRSEASQSFRLRERKSKGFSETRTSRSTP